MHKASLLKISEIFSNKNLSVEETMLCNKKSLIYRYIHSCVVLIATIFYISQAVNGSFLVTCIRKPFQCTVHCTLHIVDRQD